MARPLLTIVSVRMPHGQFKSAEQCFAPALELAAGASTQFTILVHCDEPAGLVTENAFVIFHCQWRGEAWRIFVRIRVIVNSQRQAANGDRADHYTESRIFRNLELRRIDMTSKEEDLYILKRMRG